MIAPRETIIDLLLKLANLFGCVRVEESTVGFKEKFGRFENVLEPGCYYMPWFCGYGLSGKLTLRVQQLNVKCETKTKDHVFVTVAASIHYRAVPEKASDAFYKLSNTTTQIQAYVFDVIRSTVPKLKLDDLFEQRQEIAKAVEDELEKAMSAYGYEIVQTLITDIEPDEEVKQAINETNIATRMRVAATNKAEGEKTVQIKKAEGEAEAKYISGLGISRQRQAIVDGLKDSVLGISSNVMSSNLKPKEIMEMVMLTQYFDTLREIGASSKTSAVFISNAPTPDNDHS